MVVLLIRVLLLLILPTITNQVPTFSSKKSPIDWTQCGGPSIGQAKCNCLGDQQGQLAIVDSAIAAPTATTTEAEEGKCNIGVQSKYYNSKGAFFQMQVIDHPEALGTDLQLALYQGRTLLFGCKLEKKSGKVVLEGDLIQRKQYRIQLVEYRSHFDSNNAICAVKIEKASKFFEWIISDRSMGAETILKFTTTQSVDYNLLWGTDIFSAKRARFRHCDPFEFIELKSSELNYIREVPNRDRDILNCDDYGSSYKMKYQLNGKEEDMKELKCEHNENKDIYSYKIYKENVNVGVEVEHPELYSFFCAANFNEVCEDPNMKRDCIIEKCPQYGKGSAGVPATLKCGGGKWYIEDEYHILTNDPVCKQVEDATNTNAAAFYITLPSGDSKEFPNARCFTEYDCAKKSKLNSPPCDDETKCGFDISNGVLQCRDKARNLSIYFYEKNETVTAEKYTCEKSTGMWKNASGGTIPEESVVSCPVFNTTAQSTEESEASLSDAQVNTLIGEIAAGIVIGLLTVALIGWCCFKHRHTIFKRKHRSAQEWMKLDKDRRLKICRDTFSEVLQSKVTNSRHMVEGFNMLALMLETETVEAKAWEEVYPFLMRFDGAMRFDDYQIWTMFSRYMYLQAKKILDKHGWLTDKPIRKYNGKGMLRVVAIQMLSFALRDNDANELLCDGFRKLGTKGRSQYPHCGVLWSVLPHADVLTYQNKTDPSKFRNFEVKQFTEMLRKIALDGKNSIPDDEVIPEFGTVAQQAAFAIGCSPYFALNSEFGKNILRCKNIPPEDIVGKAVAMSYFKGMCMLLTRNPIPHILQTFDIWPTLQPELMEKINMLADATVWTKLIALTSQITTYYNHFLDAKRLQSLFIPQDPNRGLDQLFIDQKMFEETIDKQMEELRDWFAARIDIDDLKIKPDYLTKKSKKNHLDATIKGPTDEDKVAEADAAAPVIGSISEKNSAATPKDSASARPTASDRNSPSAAPTPKDSARSQSQNELRASGGADQAVANDAEDPEENNQCGLEDDLDDWIKAEPPQRIKKTMLTEAEQAKFNGLLTVIFSKETLMGKRYPLDPDDVIEVVVKVIPYLKSEPVLIEDIPFPCSIVGDIHGQLYDLDRVFYKNAKDGKPGWVGHKYVFLGDYVDRGRQSLEVIIALFCIKILHPDDIFLLRGNHEFAPVNTQYGLYRELLLRYNYETAGDINNRINETFCWLSIAAIVGDAYFCAHGGISSSTFTREKFRSVFKPIVESTEHAIVNDCVWADPAFGLKGTCFNPGRATSIFFGLDVLITAMKTMGVRGVFRGHTAITGGYEQFYNVLFTVFTATAAGEDKNRGAVAVIDEQGKVTMRVLEIDMERVAWEERLCKLDGIEKDNGCLTTRGQVPAGMETKETGGIVRM